MRTIRPHPSLLRSALSAWLVGAIILGALLGLQRKGDDPPGPTAHADTPATGRLVELRGAQLVGDGGPIPVDEVSFWAWRSGWEPILWQHEKRAASGTDEPVPPDPSVLEAGDRIVLALDDLGARWPGAEWPEGIAEGTWPTEIAMHSDGSMPTSGSVYFFQAPVPPAALGLPPRIRWDEAAGRVVSEQWSVGLRRSSLNGPFFIDHVSLADDGRDLIDGWERVSYPEGVAPPAPKPIEGVIATPIISGPLRAVFSSAYQNEVIVSAKRALLRTTEAHPSAVTIRSSASRSA